MGLQKVIAGMIALSLAGVVQVSAESTGPTMLGKGKENFSLEDVPQSAFKQQLDDLSRSAKKRALNKLKEFEFPADDVDSLNVDTGGDVFYVCVMDSAAPTTAPKPPPRSGLESTIPISPFPTNLVFHSKAGAPNVIFLDMDGHTVEDTIWNTSLGRATIPARAFSLDGNYTTYTDNEQTAIKRIWQRVAEDFAPFDVDVTTEEPATMHNRVIRVLITRNTDSNGDPNPYHTSGGVSYVNYFAHPFYDYYSPSWVYYNNLSYNEGNIAEAASHEAGHFLGLSHDGRTGGTEYYAGHGEGETAWAPIMGKSYGHNVSQWSKGEYYNANNTQDDLAMLAGKMNYRPDDHGDDMGSATQLALLSNMYAFATTPETDPDNTNPQNKGIISPSETNDFWQFASGAGDMSLFINPWISPGNTRGNNLDIKASLLDSNGTVLATSDPTNATGAELTMTLTAGDYYIKIEKSSTGNPLSSTPTGYTAYASCGQYFITGIVESAVESAPANPATLTVNLTPAEAAIQEAAWRIQGHPDTNWLTSGSTVTNLASGDYTVTFKPIANWTEPSSIVTNLAPSSTNAITAAYSPHATTLYNIPIWWLVENGYTGDPETEVIQIASNGMSVWESYIAGVNPNDPNSAFVLNVTDPAAGDMVLTWQSVSGRVYSIYQSDEPGDAPQPIPDAQNMHWPRNSYTNQTGSEPCRVLQIHVMLE